jgi:hypothetical protein
LECEQQLVSAGALCAAQQQHRPSRTALAEHPQQWGCLGVCDDAQQLVVDFAAVGPHLQRHGDEGVAWRGSAMAVSQMSVRVMNGLVVPIVNHPSLPDWRGGRDAPCRPYRLQGGGVRSKIVEDSSKRRRDNPRGAGVSLENRARSRSISNSSRDSVSRECTPVAGIEKNSPHPRRNVGGRASNVVIVSSSKT